MNRVNHGLMATFAQHSGEHETTKMAMGFINYLLKGYGQDTRITKLLKARQYHRPLVLSGGYIDETGKFAIPSQFDFAGNFR